MLNLILLTPFAREICLLHGWCGVDRGVLLARLQDPGSAVAVNVGGAAEAVLSEVGERLLPWLLGGWDVGSRSGKRKAGWQIPAPPFWSMPISPPA